MLNRMVHRARNWVAGVTMVVALLWYFKVFADVPSDPATQSTTEMLNQLWQAVVSKRYGLAATMATMVLVAGARFLAPKLHNKFGAWVQSQRVSAALALIMGMASAMTAQLVKGGAFSLSLLVYGFGIGVAAIGGYNAFWDLLFPADKKMTVKPADVASPIIIPPEQK